MTTGISAADRGRTCAVAIDASKEASEVVTPGHVFPLVAMILNEPGVEDMVLLTNTHHTPVGLDGYGLRVVGERPLRRQ